MVPVRGAEFELGQAVRDRISDITGIVEFIKAWADGTIEYGIKRHGVDSNGHQWTTVTVNSIYLEAYEGD